MEMMEVAKRIQIKELPVKNEVDQESVLLIQDSEDTKQMPVSLFYDHIQKIADLLRQDTTRYLQILQNEIDRCTETLNSLIELDKQIQSNETVRINNESARVVAESERIEQFEVWRDRWQIWERFYDNTVIAENQRVANEEYRTQIWVEWTALIELWTKQENQRQINEDNRTTTFNNTMEVANTTIEEMKALIVQTNNINTINTENINQKISEVNTLIENTNKINEANTTYIENKGAYIDATIETCNTAINRCVAVTNTLDEMIDIGTAVPTSLPSAKIYLQYFT